MTRLLIASNCAGKQKTSLKLYVLRWSLEESKAANISLIKILVNQYTHNTGRWSTNWLSLTSAWPLGRVWSSDGKWTWGGVAA